MSKPLKFGYMEALRGEKMNPNAFRVLTMLWTYASADGTSARPGLKQLAQDCDMSTKTIQRWLAVLIEGGWIALSVPSRGPGHAAEYRLNPEKVDSQVSTVSEETEDSQVSTFHNRKVDSSPRKVDSQVSSHQGNNTRKEKRPATPKLAALYKARNDNSIQGLKEYGHLFAPPIPPDGLDVDQRRAFMASAKRDWINELIEREERAA